MNGVTSRDRIRACMKRTYADRVPIGLAFGPFRACVLGCSLRDYFQSGEKLVEATLACYEVFQTDTADMSWYIMIEAETVGAEALEFPEDGAPRVRRHLLSQKSALSALELPRPERSGRFPLYLEACRAAVKTLKGPALSGSATGPWTIATALRGAEQLILDTMDDPGFVEDLLRFTSEVTKILGSAVLETGLGLTMGEAAASCSLISPAIYRRFIKPRHQEIVRFFGEKKAGLSLHICGYIDPIMEDILDLGVKALSLDSPSSLKRMVEISQKKIVLVGNVATSLFVSGARQEIEEAVKQCIREAAPGGGFIISSGCDLPYNATMERVRFFIEAAKEYGKTERILGERG